MSSQCNITFGSLQALPQTQLEKLSADKVVELSLNALEKRQESVEQVLNCWSRLLLHIYNFAEIKINNIRKIFEAFVDHTNETLEEAGTKLHTEENLDLLISLLSNWKNVISCMDAKTLHLSRASILIECALKTLSNYYCFLKNSKNSSITFNISTSNELSKLFNESQDFQKLILSLMLDDFDVFICKESSDTYDIIRIINCLSAVGEIVPLLDVKLTAEIWKFISKLSSENATFMKLSSEIEGSFLWLQRPVNFLCEEIQTSILAIFEQVSVQSLDRIERILKINSFYLKLLIKFGSDFEHKYFPGSTEVIKTGFILLTPSENVVGSKVEHLIKQHLTVGVINLFSLIYKNEEFFQALFTENISSVRKFEAFYIVLREIFKMLMLEDDIAVSRMYLSSKTNILEKLFENIPKYSVVFLKKENYESLVTMLSAVLLSKCDVSDVVKIFENFLTNGILQSDLLLANICLDVWLTVSRFLNSESRYHYLCVWINHRLKLSLLTREPKAKYIQSLVRNLFDFLSNSYKDTFWNDVLIGEEHNKIIIVSTLGIDRIPDANKKEDIKTHFTTLLCDQLESDMKGITTEHYYTMVCCVQILSNTELCSNTKLQDLVQTFLSHLLQQLSRTDKHELLTTSLMEFVTMHIHKFSSNQLTQLTDLIKLNIPRTQNTSIRLYTLKFLEKLLTIDESEITKNLRNAFQKSSDNLIQIIFQFQCNNVQSTSLSGEILSDRQILNYLNQISKNTYTHKCKIFKDKRIENVKSIRFAEENHMLVKKAFDDACTILNVFKENKLCETDLKLIRQIVNIYEQIVADENKS